MERDVVAQPGYVRMALGRGSAPARVLSASRDFAAICSEESATRGLIVSVTDDAESSARLQEGLSVAIGAAPTGFKLAVVTRGPSSRRVHEAAETIAAGRRMRTKAFRSEHAAAAWLMG